MIWVSIIVGVLVVGCLVLGYTTIASWWAYYKIMKAAKGSETGLGGYASFMGAFVSTGLFFVFSIVLFVMVNKYQLI